MLVHFSTYYLHVSGRYYYSDMGYSKNIVHKFWSILLGHFIKHSKPLIYLMTSLLPLLWTLLTQSCGFCKWGHLVMIISFFSLIESSKFHRMNIIYHGGQKWMDICGRSCEELVMICFFKKSFNNIFMPRNNRVKRCKKNHNIDSCSNLQKKNTSQI